LQLELHLTPLEHGSERDFDFCGDIVATGCGTSAAASFPSSEVAEDFLDIDPLASPRSEDAPEVDPSSAEVGPPPGRGSERSTTSWAAAGVPLVVLPKLIVELPFLRIIQGIVGGLDLLKRFLAFPSSGLRSG
jgi:hypothetical protein